MDTKTIVLYPSKGAPFQDVFYRDVVVDPERDLKSWIHDALEPAGSGTIFFSCVNDPDKLESLEGFDMFWIEGSSDINS